MVLLFWNGAGWRPVPGGSGAWSAPETAATLWTPVSKPEDGWS